MTYRLLLCFPALSVLVAGCLTYEGFLSKRHDKECEELAKCNPDIPCELPYGTDTGYGNDVCAFEADLGRDCLHGDWRCADVDPHFMYVIPPQACAAVCGTTTTSTTQ